MIDNIGPQTPNPIGIATFELLHRLLDDHNTY